MSKQTKNTIKNWFKNGSFPNQFHFWDWMDSFFHKDEQIPSTQIENLQNLLDAKVDKKDLPDGDVAISDVSGLNEALDAKVDKEEGKGLSSEDFNTILKDKLEAVEENANNYQHPATHSAEMIDETAEKSFISSTEKQNLNDHIADEEIHKSSSQIRSEIVDSDLPVSIARQEDVTTSANSVIDTIRGGVDEAYNTLKKVYDWIFVHDGNTEIHKTSEQIRSEIVDVDIPSSIARQADLNAKDLQSITEVGASTDQPVEFTGDFMVENQSDVYLSAGGAEGSAYVELGYGQFSIYGENNTKWSEITNANKEGFIDLTSDGIDLSSNRIHIGNGVGKEDTRIVRNTSDINKPEIRYQDSSGKWQFSNDGVEFNNFGGGIGDILKLNPIARPYPASFGWIFVDNRGGELIFHDATSFREIYHSGNSNNFETDWNCASLSAANEIIIGDGTVANNKSIIANNADVNKPALRYNETDKKWQFSNNGLIFNDLGGGIGGGSTLQQVTTAGATTDQDVELTGQITSTTSNDSSEKFGKDALANDDRTNNGNSAFGHSSLKDNTSGSSNSAFGGFSLSKNTTGKFNSAFGNSALLNSNTGYYNSAFGNFSLKNNTTASSNSAFGSFALSENTNGDLNSAFGSGSLSDNTVGYDNSAFGYHALRYNTTGHNNVGIGTGAGACIIGDVENKLSNNSIYIGSDCKSKASSTTNEIVIGSQAEGNGSNSVTIGNSSIVLNSFNGNIKTTGSFNSVSASPLGSAPGDVNVTSGYVLTADGIGGSSWKPSGGDGGGTLSLQQVVDNGSTSSTKLTLTGGLDISSSLLRYGHNRAIQFLSSDGVNYVNGIAVGSNNQVQIGFGASTFGVDLHHGGAVMAETTINGFKVNDVLNLNPASRPVSPKNGDIYNDSSDNHLYFYNGTSWIQLG